MIFARVKNLCVRLPHPPPRLSLLSMAMHKDVTTWGGGRKRFVDLDKVNMPTHNMHWSLLILLFCMKALQSWLHTHACSMTSTQIGHFQSEGKFQWFFNDFVCILRFASFLGFQSEGKFQWFLNDFMFLKTLTMTGKLIFPMVLHQFCSPRRPRRHSVPNFTCAFGPWRVHICGQNLVP